MSSDWYRSANSGGNSKRKFNSISSNSPNKGKDSSSNSNNKRKKTQQKTLGAAWGSNSRSTNRSVFQSSRFADVGSYMEVKNQKLYNQFDAEASTSSHGGLDAEKCLFHGVSIFVDGFTVLSNQELRGYMLKYGGRFENYFSRHRVTHIICSNLPDSKIKNLRSFSGGLPVVKATWVLDSVAAKKLLSWIPYQIDQLAHESRNQPKLSAFFTTKTCRNDVDAANGTNSHVKGKEKKLVDVEDLVKSTNQYSGGSDNAVCPDSYESSKDESTSSHGNLCEDKLGGISVADTEIQSSLKYECSPLKILVKLEDTVKSPKQYCGGNDNAVCSDSYEALKDESTSSHGNICEDKLGGIPAADTEIQSSLKCECSSLQTSSSADGNCLGNNDINESTSSVLIGPCSLHHSASDDPNFVKNYFKVVPISDEGCSNTVLHTSHLHITDLMPSSLSQVDPLVLRELPKELRGGILEGLPAHRMGGQENSAAFNSPIQCPAEALDVKDTESNHRLAEFVTNNNIWSGSPPKWVDRFKISDCFILKALGESYSKLNSGGPLSCVLQRNFSQLSQSSEQSCNERDESVKGLSELLKQYIKLKIESDIEEIYACFSFLKRSRMKSRALLEVYNSVYPYIQALVCENYGGNFPI